MKMKSHENDGPDMLESTLDPSIPVDKKMDDGEDKDVEDGTDDEDNKATMTNLKMMGMVMSKMKTTNLMTMGMAMSKMMLTSVKTGTMGMLGMWTS